MVDVCKCIVPFDAVVDVCTSVVWFNVVVDAMRVRLNKEVSLSRRRETGSVFGDACRIVTAAW